MISRFTSVMNSKLYGPRPQVTHISGEAQWRRFAAKREALEAERERLCGLWVRPDPDPGQAALQREVLGDELRREARALDLLARPRVAYRGLMRLPGLGPPLDAGEDSAAVAEQLEIQAKYAGYIGRQGDEIARARAQDEQPVPGDFDFQGVRGLSAEVREKLIRVRPATLGQAARIPGVTPAAVSLLLIHLRRRGAG